MNPSSESVSNTSGEHAVENSSEPGLNVLQPVETTESLSDSVTLKSVEANSGGTSSGNNSRSFRFLLTLALRKAQTAVTLDNGSHVEEAIRTYREAISMLGLVLNRTNEEDGRQRLLHFRQTYSDRVAVLSSARPLIGQPATNANAKSSQKQQQQQQDTRENLSTEHQKPKQQHQQHQEKHHPDGSSGQINNAPSIADKSPDNGDGKVKVSADLQPESSLIDSTSQKGLTKRDFSDEAGNTTSNVSHEDTDTLFKAESGVASLSPEQQSPLKSSSENTTFISASSEQSTASQTPIAVSPTILNKPLPLLSVSEEPEHSSNRDSTSSAQSMYSANHSNAGALKDGGSLEQKGEDGVSKPAKDESNAEQPAAPVVATVATTSMESNRTDDARSLKELRIKKKERDSEKASRRQSVKNQRSLPAMFGIGVKTKSDKPTPPVPQLPIAEPTAPTLGRRIFGALRSNSSSNDLPASKIPSISASSVTIGAAASNAIKSEAGPFPDMSNFSESEGEPQSDTPKVEHISSSTGLKINQSIVNGGDEKTAAPLGDSEVLHEADEDPVPSSIPPPTPAKDTPPVFPFKLPLQQTLTKEQKRQSNAAHRLAGLFRRKPSIPDIPSPALPPKSSIESNKPLYGMLQPPSQLHAIPKDRRLSASTSTPNLVETASAAANNDQSSLAVYAATERGDIPPMPAPPSLRPSFSSTVPVTTYADGRQSAGEGEYESKEDEGQEALGFSGRQMRSDSDASSVANLSTTSRTEDLRHKKQHSQTIRPSLRIATKSAMDVLSFVPESSPAPGAPLSAGTDGPSRSRKSSVATSGSQSVIRGGTGLLSGTASVLMNGAHAMSTPLVASFPGIHAYNRPTLIDIEEDQRVEMFEPSFGTFHPDLGPAPPKSNPLSALWFINTLHRSMVTGGAHLTPSLYVPRRLWYQPGIRITAIETKLGVLAQLTQSFSSLGSFISLPDIEMLFLSTAPNIDPRHAETLPWESEDPRSRNSNSKDDLHKACVALHHWLNNFEEVLDSSRRMLGKKLKFVNSTPQPGTEAAAAASVMAVPATASHENLNASIVHMPAGPAMGLTDNTHFANASLPSLALSNSDLAGHQGAPASPLSPTADQPEMRIPETPVPMTPSGNGAQSIHNMNRDVLNKDQMSNSRFKGLGKFGKSVDKLYSNIQKEKLDDTSVYASALQRMFEAAMVLEGIMCYFSRIASDADMAGWFTEVPQSPSSLTNKRRQQSRPQGSSDASIRGPMSSPLTAQATLAAEPSAPSINSLSERKSSNASISANSAAEKKNRRRSNYFGQKQSGSGGNSSNLVDSGEGMRNGNGKAGAKPRGDSFSTIPKIVPVMPMAAGASNLGTAAANGSSGRFVLAQSPIKNPLSYVQQGKGRAPGVIYARLIRITEWLNQVLLAWVVRDLQVLYAKYIKRLREWVVE